MIAVLLLSGCTDSGNQTEPPGNIIPMGGKYNLSLVVIDGVGYMNYWMNGELVETGIPLDLNIRTGLDWIRENSAEDAKVFSWWDYGHAIQAYGEREPLVLAPSYEILNTTVSQYIGIPLEDIECNDCSDHEVIVDIATAFLSTDPSVLVGTMEKYGTTILYVNKDDREKSYAMYIAAGMEPMHWESEGFQETNLYKILENEALDGLDIAFYTTTNKIYYLV